MIKKKKKEILYTLAVTHQLVPLKTLSLLSLSILYFHQQCMRVPVLPHLHQYLLLSEFLITVFLAGVKHYFIVVLICIFLIANHSIIFLNTDSS